jgi:indolepyruvate ferredoxin oxidoreductase beta subunit
VTATSGQGKSLNIAILAMGGEGGGVLADWIVDMAEHAGYYVQTTSVPGVAQRTGATIYYVEIFPEIGGQQPVLALMPFPGEVDIVIASELMEAGRAILRGLVTPERTTFIASTHRVYSMTEKTAMGDGRVDAQALLDACRAAAQWFVAGDFARAAEESGSVISAVMFGALAGTGRLPFSQQAFEEAIRRSGVGVESSLAAFGAGHRIATQGEAATGAATATPAATVGPALRPLADRVERAFPAAARTTLLAGIRRLADYQDLAYAAEYLDRLTPIVALDRAPDWRLLNETARHLALWMSYEDTIRVADLKTRRQRFERVRGEVRLGDDQLLQINEFLHPRVDEIADTLPAGLGRWLLRSGWARALVGRFASRGRIVQTSSIGGYLLLYFVASLRRMRRTTLRFAEETGRIEAWLAGILETASADHALAVEVAACQGLVKGYSDTHARGLRNFQTVMSALPAVRGKPDAPARLRSLREAALADESGARLASVLKEIQP